MLNFATVAIQYSDKTKATLYNIVFRFVLSLSGTILFVCSSPYQRLPSHKFELKLSKHKGTFLSLSLISYQENQPQTLKTNKKLKELRGTELSFLFENNDHIERSGENIKIVDDRHAQCHPVLHGNYTALILIPHHHKMIRDGLMMMMMVSQLLLSFNADLWLTPTINSLPLLRNTKACRNIHQDASTNL